MELELELDWLASGSEQLCFPTTEESHGVWQYADPLMPESFQSTYSHANLFYNTDAFPKESWSSSLYSTDQEASNADETRNDAVPVETPIGDYTYSLNAPIIPEEFYYPSGYPSQLVHDQRYNTTTSFTVELQDLPSQSQQPLAPTQIPSTESNASDSNNLESNTTIRCQYNCDHHKEAIDSLLAWKTEKSKILEDIITWSSDVTQTLEIIARCCLADKRRDTGSEHTAGDDTECLVKLLSLFNLLKQ